MIYLDNAATTWPKPPAVGAAMCACMRHAGGNPGRGAHTAALRAAEVVYETRCLAAECFGVADPTRVVFTMNTTHALNIAVKGLLASGDHVLTGDMEHNATRRPLAALEEIGVCVSRFRMRQETAGLLTELCRLLRPETKLLVCTHQSNIANITLPVHAIGRFCRERGILFILDGAQSAGILPIHMEMMGIDALCIPGHKGLYGPQGCGMLLLGSRCPLPHPLMEGGSGSHSADRAMPPQLPEHLEAGTLPTPAIAGLGAGLRFIAEAGMEAIHRHECGLWRRMAEGLSSMKRVRIVEDTPGSILLFTVQDASPAAVADALDHAGICVRAGYHCAPLAHRVLGTERDGAVRISFSAMNTEREVEGALDAMAGVLREL